MSDQLDPAFEAEILAGLEANAAANRAERGYAENRPEAPSDLEAQAEEQATTAGPGGAVESAPQQPAGPAVVSPKETVKEQPAPQRQAPAKSGEKAESWIDADVKATAALFGVDDSDLAEFTNRADFERSLRFATKSLSDSGRAAIEAARPKAPAAPVAPVAPVAPQQPAAPTVSKFADKFTGDKYEPEVVEMAKALDELREQFTAKTLTDAQRQQQQAQSEQDRFYDAFDGALDSLDAERFGKAFDDTGKYTPVAKEAHEARQKVLDMADLIAAGARQRNRPLPPLPVLTKLAYDAVYGKENATRAAEAAKKEVIGKVAARSRQRMGGGQRTPTPAPFKGRPSENPDLLAEVEDIMSSAH